MDIVIQMIKKVLSHISFKSSFEDLTIEHLYYIVLALHNILHKRELLMSCKAALSADTNAHFQIARPSAF